LAADIAKDDAFHRKDNKNELSDDFYAITFIGFVYLDDPSEI
jgi:hypothetical protein